MPEIVADFAAESSALGRLLEGLTEAEWLLQTPAAGWDVRDSVTHLAASNELALKAVVHDRFDEMERLAAASSIEAYELEHLAPGRAGTGAEVLAWWRASTDALVDALASRGPEERFPWGPNRLSLASFTTARLMETWAHGLDCFAAVGVDPVDTDRLRHVADLGLRSLPFAFAIKGLAAPGTVRLTLAAPDGTTWELGPADAASWVSGAAADWCRAAVNRDRDGERARLVGGGAGGKAVIANVQAYLAV